MKIAQSDTDCQLLVSHPGIGPLVAVAIKARVGDDVSRFPTKKHFCSYAGVVPRTDDSGEHKSEHGRVKHGDLILKYALTCGVNGAGRAGQVLILLCRNLSHHEFVVDFDCFAR